MADDKRLLQAACEFINANWSDLHHEVKSYEAKIGPGDIVGSHRENESDFLIVVVNRGILGSPKYRVPLAELEKARVAPVAARKGRPPAAVESEAE